MNRTLLTCVFLIVASLAGCLDSFLDDDNDGLVNDDDNCPLISNSDQVDTDDDGQGDACDTDDDGDGVEDESDDFPLDEAESIDTDDDGIGNNADTDDDNDGYLDDQEEFNCGQRSNSLDSTDKPLDTDSDFICDELDEDDVHSYYVEMGGDSFDATNGNSLNRKLIVSEREEHGWLHKKGNDAFNAQWKKRWFVMEDDALTYYETPESRKAQGSIELTGLRCMRAEPEKRKSKSSNLYTPFIIEISFTFVPFTSVLKIALKSLTIPLITASLPGLYPKIT